MPAHKHAALMLQYSQDAQETDKPWERWEALTKGVWTRLVAHPNWLDTSDYRHTVATIKVNGFDVPEPLKEAPKQGTTFYIASPSDGYFYIQDIWTQYPVDFLVLHRGIAHLTASAASTHAKAMLGIDPNSGE